MKRETSQREGASSLRIVFMGTPEFAVPSLEQLVEAGYRPVAVVTGPDRPRGRGQRVQPTPVKAAAERLGLSPILQPASVRDPAFAAAIAALRPDVIVVVAFKILPPEVYTQARRGAFNLHASLLPRYRGAAPIHRAIMAGETETGVTTFFLQPQVDTGDIILQKRTPIGPEETAGELHDRLMQLGAEAVLETVRLIERGEVHARPQDDRQATQAPKLTREEARVPWNRPAPTVHNHIRGLSPHPGAWTMHGDRRLKLYRSRQAEGEGPPGTVLEANDRLVVACGEGAVEILELQQEGRRILPAPAFLRGYPLRPGDRLT
ncbi:MAG: methionyl-tRNA formyltransferase [Rhodothermus sp.]|nr:methionyl-tRNA formyltransferase [Rhodothermus sp.]